ncbi:MAG: FAD-dependent oxidoreductase, partial [Candidatus Peregrinibacteria bacterium]
MNQSDTLIIGTGIAGLIAAHLRSAKGKVTVVTKGQLKEANTYWAQGGIAAVMEKDDSFESHSKDTLKAGANYSDPKAVKFLVENAAKAVRLLQELGVKFEKTPALEAGHSKARVWHTSDFTGRDILNALIKAVKKNREIEVLEETEAVELIVHNNQCRGIFIRRKEDKEVTPLLANHTILATGGLGQLFGRTTNTLGSGGDGIAMAVNAGLEPKDLEFMQFHPTAFAKPDGGRYFLLSETLRGFGAKILNHKGAQFLTQFHTDGELAPRDIVSRAVFFELMNGPVYLSMSHLNAGDIRQHYTNIVKRIKSYGYDLT